jgi:hypothetical protein
MNPDPSSRNHSLRRPYLQWSLFHNPLLIGTLISALLLFGPNVSNLIISRATAHPAPSPSQMYEQCENTRVAGTSRNEALAYNRYRRAMRSYNISIDRAYRIFNLAILNAEEAKDIALAGAYAALLVCLVAANFSLSRRLICETGYAIAAGVAALNYQRLVRNAAHAFAIAADAAQSTMNSSLDEIDRNEAVEAARIARVYQNCRRDTENHVKSYH